HPGGPSRPAAGRRGAYHGRHVLLRQPYAPARSAGVLAGRSVRARSAAHLEIIYRINTEHLAAAKLKNPSASDSLGSISLIDEHNGRKLRMGHLAFVGSHRINGVSALHTNLMRKTVFRDLHAMYPDRIVNKTNGI